MGEPGEGYLIDSNFMHCNQTSEDGGQHDGDGHCHGSDADSTYGWWVRDHWNRGYAGTLNCCCGWSDLQELAIVNRCDYRHTVLENNTDRNYRPDSCRDANEEHGMGFDLRGDGDSAGTPAGCPAAGNPTFSDPLDANPGQCWSVQNFGYNDDPPGTRPPTRPATPTPPPPTSRPNGQPTSTPPPLPCSSDPSWRDDAFNGCDSDQINAAWCRDAGDEMFRQADGRMMSGNQACTQCGACNTAPTTRPPTTRPPTTPAPTSSLPTTRPPISSAPPSSAPTTSDGTTTHRLSWGFRSRNVALSINAGDTVTWVLDQDHHTTHDVVSGVRGAVDIGELFRSERQSQGEFSVTFITAGAYPFFCSPHFAMRGTITVASAPTTAAPTPASPTPPAPTSISPTTRSPTTPAPTTAPGECENLQYFCNIWASLGYCVASLEYDDFMHRECPVACHTCPGNEHPTPPRNTGPTTTSSTTARPATPAPTTASPTDASVPCHFTSCGRSGRCSETASCAMHEERHEVRCCSDSLRAPAWTQRSSSCPWTESNNFNGDNTACLSSKSYDEAAGFCTSVGARLCTVDEAEADCLRGTGCGHDSDLIWTSDAGRTSAAMGRLAMAVDAEAAPFRQTTSTAEPDASVDLATSTGTDAAESSTTDSAPAVIGAVFGVIIVAGLAVGMFVMHRRRSAGRPSKETAPATVEEGLSLRLKSVRRGNPAFVNSVVLTDKTPGVTGI